MMGYGPDQLTLTGFNMKKIFNIEFKHPGVTPKSGSVFPQDWQVIIKCQVNGKTMDYCRVTLDRQLDEDTYDVVYLSPRAAIAAAREACQTAQKHTPSADIIGAVIQVF